jgi:abortive infection bacteriophage resistance protein
MGLILFEEEEDLQRVVVITQIRNLIVHNRAIVNRIFLSRMPAFSTKLGETLEIEIRGVFSDISFLLQTAFDIDMRACQKFALPQPIGKIEKDDV